MYANKLDSKNSVYGSPYQLWDQHNYIKIWIKEIITISKLKLEKCNIKVSITYQ